VKAGDFYARPGSSSISRDFFFSAKNLKVASRQLSFGFSEALAQARPLRAPAKWAWFTKRRRQDAGAIRYSRRNTLNIRAVALELMPQKIQITTAGAAVIASVWLWRERR
jgi:hypothetical protein